MVYNPYLLNMYNPYAQQVYNQQTNQQPINGLIFIDNIDDAKSYQMPPGSMSPPLFLKDTNDYVIKTFDMSGGATIDLYHFEKVTPSDETEKAEDIVTKSDFEEFKQQIMEAINGKHTISESSEEKSE